MLLSINKQRLPSDYNDQLAAQIGRSGDKDDLSQYIQQSIKQDLMQAEGGRRPSTEQIHKICITGGPCAGKTTALAMLQSDL